MNEIEVLHSTVRLVGPDPDGDCEIMGIVELRNAGDHCYAEVDLQVVIREASGAPVTAFTTTHGPLEPGQTLILEAREFGHVNAADAATAECQLGFRHTVRMKADAEINRVERATDDDDGFDFEKMNEDPFG